MNGCQESPTLDGAPVASPTTLTDHGRPRSKPKKEMITPERLREVLSYDPETGVFVWRVHLKKSRMKIGERAGHKKSIGYRYIGICGYEYLEHRLAWLYVYGEWPEYEIDHRNRVRSDNRILNIRQATKAENGQNQKLRSTNTSGTTGVSWSKLHLKWVAYIMVDNKHKHLGLFNDIDDAKAAHLNAKRKLHSFQPVPRDIMR